MSLAFNHEVSFTDGGRSLVQNTFFPNLYAGVLSLMQSD